MVAIHEMGGHDANTSHSHPDLAAELKRTVPEGGMAYSSLGYLASVYEDAGSAEVIPVIDDIALAVAEDFERWEKEMDGATPPALVIINRKDAGGAISLWEAHPSEETEAAARHILHYATVATPKAMQQAWADAYRNAFELMVRARNDHEADPSNELLTLTSALRQNKIARRGVELVEQYDDLYRRDDN